MGSPSRIQRTEQRQARMAADLQLEVIEALTLAIEAKDRKFLEGEMEKYFFGEGSARPEQFRPAEDA